MKRFTMIALIGLTILALGACTRQVLAPAPVITVPAGLSHSQIERAVVNALDARGWTLDKRDDGTILTSLHLRGHTATVRVTYDSQSVHIDYVSSSNLDFSQRGSTRYIHRNYNGWITFLVQDIRRNLQNATLTTSS